MSNKIQFVIAIPKSAKYYGYYINNNLEDKHLMKRDDFYFFIAPLLESPLPSQIRNLIDTNQTFMVDIKNNEVEILLPDKKANSEELKKEKFKNIIKKFKKKKISEKKKENKENFYDGSISTLFTKLGIK